MMKHLWALPAILRVVLASQHHFSVFDDLLAYPQYEILYSDSVVSEDYAEKALSAVVSRNSPQSTAVADPPATSDTSLHRPFEKHSHLEPELHLDSDIATYENMILNDMRYLCSIPRVPDEDTHQNNTKPNPDEEEKELARATTRGWELLQEMEGSCLYFFSGWWSYSFCYGDEVRQFHQLPPGKNVPVYPPVEDQGVTAYILGKFDGGLKSGKKGGKKDGTQKTLGGKAKLAQDSGSGGNGRETRERGLARLEAKGEMRYLVQKLKGGTICDLTGKERNIEVQASTCLMEGHPERISLIKETAICQYVMVISTPRLCNDVAFQPPKASKPHAIACTPVLPEASIPAYLAEKEAADSKIDANLDLFLEEEVEAYLAKGIPLPTTPIIIGDIEVGGHAIVPKGKKIEKSVVVGGGKETLIATIAKSDGFIASDSDMKKVGIRTHREVEGVKKEVERVADGKAWRLDVVETPRGKELRGVIEEDEDGETTKGVGDKKIGKKLTTQKTLLDAKKDYRDRLEAAEKASSEGDVLDEFEDSEEGSDETYKEEL
ncbi:hypothetical protein BLS_001926 [Venturia inaequalis]|uniref:Endoplasmic reticulum lectin n=1 Tax=Venturia inaequalis TaxID=5025 RepID=A0A8H3YWT7_VENIN|nr:hypothetical protein BLS_001926 [Venturia inaequalis]RDI89170.1 hypothetical protein Vi05172_g700 [Venturia inaequalis]